MKFTKVITPFILLTVAAFGCQWSGRNGSINSAPNPNTDLKIENAQRAVNTFIGNRGTLTVQGIREKPAENTAIADLQFSHEGLDTSMGRPSDYNGPGYAVFTHYSDGRWVLTTVGRGSGSAFELRWTASVPAQ